MREVDQKDMVDPIFVYKSPEITDLEKNKIQLKFFSNFPCKCTSIVVKESSFELQIDKSKLTSDDTGDQLVSI